MPDYTPLGLQKIAEQAARDVTLIRCPRDGAVMRVLASRTEGLPHDESSRERAQRRWVKSSVPPTEVDVECPACRRRAKGIRPVRRAVDDAAVAGR